jgi:hypothetical protein
MLGGNAPGVRAGHLALRALVLLVLFGCGAAPNAATPNTASPDPAAPSSEQLAAAAAEINITDVVANAPAPTVSGAEAAASATLVATSSADGRSLQFALLNHTGEDFEVLMRDNLPYLDIETFDKARGHWAQVWTLQQSRCGNAEWGDDIAPGRALRGVLVSTSNAPPRRARLVLGALRSNEVSLAIDPALVMAMTNLAARKR